MPWIWSIAGIVTQHGSKFNPLIFYIMLQYAKIERHPLRGCYCVFIPALPFVPPFFGTLRECKKAAAAADKKAAEYLKK